MSDTAQPEGIPVPPEIAPEAPQGSAPATADQATASHPDADSLDTAAVEAEAAMLNDRFGSVFDIWVNDYIRDSPASRDVLTWNHLTSVALPALRRALTART